MAWADQYDPARGDVLAWLLGRVAPSTLADHFHDRWRQQQTAHSEATRQTLAADPPAPTAPDNKLAAAVAALPPRQRAVVELIYLEGQQVTTSAALLARSRFTLHYHSRRALHTLQGALTPGQVT